jgi:hypothetical protein
MHKPKRNQNSELQLSSLIKSNEKAIKTLSKQNETDYKMVQAFTYKKQEMIDTSPKHNYQVILEKTRRKMKTKSVSEKKPPPSKP